MGQGEIETMTDQEIETYIAKHIHNSESTSDNHENRNRFGEVFTPPILINELLDALPSSVWSDPSYRWLDPAAGTGHFLALVYVRLMKTLSNKIPNLEKRKTHILENMLFMVEKNPKNVVTLRRLFGSRVHISLADFLEQGKKWSRDLGSTTFHVIIGNPPFQKDKKGATYKGSAGHQTLWDAFIKIALTGPILEPFGHLAFITPANWRRPDNDMYDLMVKDNHLLFLHIYGKKEGQELFGIQSRFDTYVIERTNENDRIDRGAKLLLIDEKGDTHRDIQVDKWPFLPNYAYDKIRKILVKNRADGIPILFHSADYDARKLIKRKTRKFRWPVVHGITKKGLTLRYAQERKSTQFGQSKVLLNFNEKQYPYNDYKGQFGMSQLTFGIPIRSKQEGDRWIKVLTSDDFTEILEATKWSAFQTDYRMFRYFDRNLYRKSLH